jgi:hypothetical protein
MEDQGGLEQPSPLSLPPQSDNQRLCRFCRKNI